MKIVNYREEDFGHIVISDKAAYLIDSKAKDILEVGNDVDLEPYLLKKLRYKEPFYLRSPIGTTLEVTKRCNLDCEHCYLDAGKARENELTKEEIFKILDELNKMKVFLLIFTGGEPFIRDDFIEILNYASNLDFYIVETISNGSLLNKKLIGEIPKNISISISTDGYSKSCTRGYPFEKMKENILFLKERNFPVSIWWNVNKKNIPEFREMAEWSIKNNFYFFVTDIMPVGRAKNNKVLIPTIEDSLRDIESHNIFKERKEDVLKTFENLKESLNPFKFMTKFEALTNACKGGRSDLYISSNGGLFPCSTCAAENRFLAGNLREKSMNEIWNTSFIDIRSFSYENFKNCKSCELSKFNCPYRCPIYSENLNDGDSFVCGATPFLKVNAIDRKKFWETF